MKMKSKTPSKFIFAIGSVAFILIIVTVVLFLQFYSKKEGFDRPWYEYVDVIYYINLDERADLRTEFLEEMRKMGVPDEKIVRIPGVQKPGKEEWGRSLSHMIAMEYFLDTSHNNCIVFEDDFVFTQDLQTVNAMFADVFENSRNFDIIMLSADESNLRPTEHKYLEKVFDTEGASGYMVNRYYAQPLMQNLQDGAKTIEKSYESGNPDKQFRVDKYWKRIQPQSNWFMFSPKLGRKTST